MLTTMVTGISLENNGVELLLAEATDIDCEAQVLHTTQGDVGYERLIIATGSRPAMPPIPGSDLDSVYAIAAIPVMEFVVATLVAVCAIEATKVATTNVKCVTAMLKRELLMP